MGQSWLDPPVTSGRRTVPNSPYLRAIQAQGFNPGNRTYPAKSPERASDVRLKVRTNSRVEVPIGKKHWSERAINGFRYKG